MVAPAVEEPDLQMTVLQMFLAAQLYRSVWGGSLAVCVGLQAPGRALALAVQAAGGAGLFLDDDPAALRTAAREGSCTFTVNALEEAIRILKNEIRQRRPIAVALRQQPAVALREMLRRGLQPNAVALARDAAAGEVIPVAELHRRGAVLLAGFALSGLDGAVDLGEVLLPALRLRWQLGTDVASTFTERRLHDAELLATAQASAATEDVVSRMAISWLRVVPSLLPRALHRAFVTQQPNAVRGI